MLRSSLFGCYRPRLRSRPSSRVQPPMPPSLHCDLSCPYTNPHLICLLLLVHHCLLALPTHRFLSYLALTARLSRIQTLCMYNHLCTPTCLPPFRVDVRARALFFDSSLLYTQLPTYLSLCRTKSSALSLQPCRVTFPSKTSKQMSWDLARPWLLGF